MTHPDGEHEASNGVGGVAQFAITDGCTTAGLTASIDELKRQIAAQVVADGVVVEAVAVAIGYDQFVVIRDDVAKLQGEPNTRDMLAVARQKCHPVLLLGYTRDAHPVEVVLPDPYDGGDLRRVDLEVPR